MKNHHQGEGIYCNLILELSNCPTNDGCLLTLDAVLKTVRPLSPGFILADITN